jgi:hypothetical protein
LVRPVFLLRHDTAVLRGYCHRPCLELIPRPHSPRNVHCAWLHRYCRRWASTHPEHFAAIAPVCGGLGSNDPEQLKEMPIWLFVGADDGGAKRCDETNATMKALGADIKYTVYPDAPAPFQPTDSSPERGPQPGHDSWSAAYADPALYEWLLSHSLAAGAAPGGTEEAEGGGGLMGWVRGLFGAKL